MYDRRAGPDRFEAGIGNLLGRDRQIGCRLDAGDITRDGATDDRGMGQAFLRASKGGAMMVTVSSLASAPAEGKAIPEAFRGQKCCLRIHPQTEDDRRRGCSHRSCRSGGGHCPWR